MVEGITSPVSEGGPELIRTSGWGQCSVVSPADLASFVAKGVGLGKSFTPEMCAVVLSQSCDVLAGSYEDEPIVELILANPLEKSDWRYVRLRNPRKLHVPLTVAQNETYHEVVASGRVTIPRELLENIAPDPTRSVPETSRRNLITWILERYIRPAFPDAFVARLETVEKRLDNLFKKKSSATTGVWVWLNTQDELAAGTAYVIVGTKVTVKTGTYADAKKLKSADEFALELGKILAECDGIECDDLPKVFPESHFSLDDVRVYQRLDKSTYDAPP